MFSVKVLSRSGPFICDKCGAILGSRDSFHMHNAIRHRNASMFCDLCPESFTQKCKLKTHMEKDHLKLKTKCNVCHKFVSNMNAHLKHHVKAKCPICSAIITRPNLTTHIKRHKKKLNNKQRRSKKLT